jgi:hypothetical protein
MKKQFWLITFVIALFVYCDKNNEATENESLMFRFHRHGGWSGLSENLKITSGTTHYSIGYMNPFTSEWANYQTTIKTTGKQWNYLMETFDFETFNKIQNGPCYACVDGVDYSFFVSKDNREYSFSNGDGDEHYQQIQGFFDTMLMQTCLFNMYSAESRGCSSFCVYKTNSESIAVAVTGQSEKLNLSQTEQMFDLSKTDTQDLTVEIKKFTSGSQEYYCDCVFEGEVLDTWTATTGTVKIKIVKDYDGHSPAFDKPYTISVKIKDVILENSLGSILVIDSMEFNEVNVGDAAFRLS